MSVDTVEALAGNVTLTAKAASWSPTTHPASSARGWCAATASRSRPRRERSATARRALLLINSSAQRRRPGQHQGVRRHLRGRDRRRSPAAEGREPWRRRHHRRQERLAARCGRFRRKGPARDRGSQERGVGRPATDDRGRLRRQGRRSCPELRELQTWRVQCLLAAQGRGSPTASTR